MRVVTLEMSDGSRRRVEVDLDRLTPRARALAEIVAATPLQMRRWLYLESTRTVRDLGPAEAEQWWTPEQLDEPHRVIWVWLARYPVDSTIDPHNYLEEEVGNLPIGYFPVGPAPGPSGRVRLRSSG